MLVICNGAIKSGSTWLYNIIDGLVPFEPPPEHYWTANSKKRRKNPCISPALLESFLENEDIENRNFLSKNHLVERKHLQFLKANQNVVVLDIERDLRDMVVSAYFDECNRNGFEGSFSEYYWRKGRYVANHVNDYHLLWRDFGERFCMVSYERLHSDFAEEVRRIAAVLRVSIDDEQIVALKEKTSMGSLRSRYQDSSLYEGDKFFRKGVVGDWKNHFDEATSADIARIEEHGISSLDIRSLLARVGIYLGRWPWSAVR